MRLISTRGGPFVDLPTALRQGPAPDGGLYLPERLPPLGSPSPEASFADTAATVLAPFLADELGADAVRSLAREAFDFPLPLVEVAPDTSVLELFHGPTAAFKDVGARFLARALAGLAPIPPGERRTVLVATSGDTGGAVARAFHGQPDTRVVVLFPHGRVSERQRRQFTTAGDGVLALAVHGPFDACQRLARAAFADSELRARHGLTSANSLNVGRLLPQIAYYVHAAAVSAARGAHGPPLFVVPSGNLGNLTAGVLAARMGLPVQGFVAALNANDSFARELAGPGGRHGRDGRDPGRGDGPGAGDDGGFADVPTVSTLSSAMDVGRPSNLERLRALAGDRAMGDALGIVAHSVDDDATRRAMADLHRRAGYLADPHTAVGFEALARVRADGRAGKPAIVLATAHPAKFPEAVRAATGREPPLPPALAALGDLPERITTLDPALDALTRALEQGGGS